MYDELSEELRNLEARIRELRELLAARRNYRVVPDETPYQIASLLLTARSANETGEALLRSLRTAVQGAPAGYPGQMDEAQADLYRALGINYPFASREQDAPPSRDDWKRPRDLPGPDLPRDDDGPGGALVGAGPKLPTAPRVPGAERTFEEALEPPRNP